MIAQHYDFLQPSTASNTLCDYELTHAACNWHVHTRASVAGAVGSAPLASAELLHGARRPVFRADQSAARTR